VYYAQRASAGLLISEATHVSEDSISRPDETTFYSGGDGGYIDYSTLAKQNALAEPATS
jgi:2,4-dienoyl-CoA reductase-like NADH-dependent reductase (Old Yellow Enzyme family)